MKLYVNEKLISIHRRFYVKNELGNDVFEISSKPISIGDKTSIYDMNNNKLAYIEQEIFHLMPNYNIYINENYVCKITKKFQLFKNDYTLTNGYRIEGNFLMLDFKIFDSENNKIGSITKKFISLSDKYEIEIYEEKYTLIVLSIIAAISNDINRSQQINNNN